MMLTAKIPLCGLYKSEAYSVDHRYLGENGGDPGEYYIVTQQISIQPFTMIIEVMGEE